MRAGAKKESRRLGEKRGQIGSYEDRVTTAGKRSTSRTASLTGHVGVNEGEREGEGESGDEGVKWAGALSSSLPCSTGGGWCR